MLDDIYILHDYVKTVNDKMSDIDTSRVIRRIVTYHYTVPTVVWMVVAKEIVTNHSWEHKWGRSFLTYFRLKQATHKLKS